MFLWPSFSYVLLRDMMTTFAAGIAWGGASGGRRVQCRGGAPGQAPARGRAKGKLQTRMFVLEPCSPSVTLVTNPHMHVGHAKVKFSAQLNMVSALQCPGICAVCHRCVWVFGVGPGPLSLHPGGPLCWHSHGGFPWWNALALGRIAGTVHHLQPAGAPIVWSSFSYVLLSTPCCCA
jgi:hypothetical protein